MGANAPSQQAQQPQHATADGDAAPGLALALPGHLASARPTPGTATGLPDVPLTVLAAYVLPLLEPGHRLDLRAVCRAWQRIVHGDLSCQTLNVLAHASFLRGPARSGAGGSPAPILARYPHARDVRIWVGRRPPALLIGRNGGCHGSAAACGASGGRGWLWGHAAAPTATATDGGKAAANPALLLPAWLWPPCLPAGRPAVAGPRPSAAAAPGTGPRSIGGVHSGDDGSNDGMQRDDTSNSSSTEVDRRAAAGCLWHKYRGSCGVKQLRDTYTADDDSPGAFPPLPAVLPAMGASSNLLRFTIITSRGVRKEDLDVRVWLWCVRVCACLCVLTCTCICASLCVLACTYICASACARSRVCGVRERVGWRGRIAWDDKCTGRGMQAALQHPGRIGPGAAWRWPSLFPANKAAEVARRSRPPSRGLATQPAQPP